MGFLLGAFRREGKSVSRTKIIFPRDRVSRESSPSAEGRSSSHFLFLYLPLLLGLCALELSPTPELPHDVRRLNLSVESLLTHVEVLPFSWNNLDVKRVLLLHKQARAVPRATQCIATARKKALSCCRRHGRSLSLPC